jgi:hypothetical protein
MRSSLSFFLLFITLASFGQHKKLDTATSMVNLKTSVNRMKQSLMDGDYPTFTSYIHPQVANLVGGKDKLIELTKESYKILEIEGYKISAVTIEYPAAIIDNSPDNLQTIVQENLTLKNKKGRLISKSYLIAISNDMGATWFFIETSGKTLDEMKSVFPFLNNNLVIPKKEKPQFYRDDAH